jgi:hypothetical protein
MKNLLGTVFTLATITAHAAGPPNFVLVYVDDLGWAETSVEMINGREDTRSDYFQTPHIARIAKDGMVLSSCYSPSTLCAPFTQQPAAWNDTQPASLHRAVFD